MNKRVFLLRVAWAMCLLLVVVGSLLPESSTPIRLLNDTGLSDKVDHILAYAALAFLPVLSESRRRLVLYLVLVAALGIALEFLQELTPDRSFELADMRADFLGIALGCLAAFPFRRAWNNSASAERQP